MLGLMKPSAHQRRTLLACLVPLALVAPVDAATIHRCHAEGEPPAFRQFPCRSRTGAGRYEMPPLQIVEYPSLTQAEKARLEALERRRRARRAEARQRRLHERREARRREARQTALCREARAALRALDRQRRKGYSLAEARSLDREEARLEAQERENC
ncbi:MAG: hypothetical protein ACODAC_01830 [Pseudomonadota bacterium]